MRRYPIIGFIIVFLFIVGIIFVILRIFSILYYNWWLITSPLWIDGLFIIILAIWIFNTNETIENIEYLN